MIQKADYYGGNCISHLRYHLQFVNVKLLFQDVMIWVKFSINIYSSKLKSPELYSISNLYQPSTCYESENHNGMGVVPGLKTDDNEWEVKGHKQRFIHVDIDKLKFFALLYNSPGTPAIEANLPSLHAEVLVGVLEKISYQRIFFK